jgi:hypothetical protein
MSALGLPPALERFRRRAGLTAGVSIALAAASVMTVIAECIRWYWCDESPGRLSTVVPAALTAGVAAMAVAWMRRPPLRDVARTIDARLSLQAAVVTAFQCRDEHDVFAVRTVARAMQVLSSSRPADVYPWHLSRTCVALTAPSALVWLALLMAPAPASDAGRAPGRVTRRSPGGVPSQAASSSTQPATSRSAGAPPGTRAATTDASQPDAQPVRATPPSPAPPLAAQAPDGGGETPGNLGQSQATAGRDGTQAPRPSRAEGGGSASLTARDAPGRSGTGATAPGGGRTGAGTGYPVTNVATERARPDGESSTVRQLSTTDEQALALDRVPMHRRTYVQRYLASLRLGQE